MQVGISPVAISPASRQLCSLALHPLGIQSPTDVNDLTDIQQAVQNLAQGHVDTARTAAAAENQQGFETLFQVQSFLGFPLVCGEQLRPHRIAGDRRLVDRKVTLRLLNGDGHSLGQATQNTDGQARLNVWQIDQYGHPSQPSGYYYRYADVSSGNKDGLRSEILYLSQSLSDSGQRLGQVADNCPGGTSPYGGSADAREGQSGPGDQLSLDTWSGAQVPNFPFAWL